MSIGTTDVASKLAMAGLAAKAMASTHSAILSRPPSFFVFPHRSFHFFGKFGSLSSLSPLPPSSLCFSTGALAGARPKSKPPVSSLLEVGRVKIEKDDVVRENDPTNNVPDGIFSKIGLQLHRRDDHPLGLLKNAIYSYFDKNYSAKFNKFDDLCPLVSVKQNFDDVLVPADHASRSYNDTYYVDAQTVLRCHTSAHQAELLREGHSHFLVTGDVYRRDSIDSAHYPVFHQMEGFRIFSSSEWESSDMDGTSYAAEDLKRTLVDLARYLFGVVACAGLIHIFLLLIHPLKSKYVSRRSGWRYWDVE